MDLAWMAAKVERNREKPFKASAQASKVWDSRRS